MLNSDELNIGDIIFKIHTDKKRQNGVIENAVVSDIEIITYKNSDIVRKRFYLNNEVYPEYEPSLKKHYYTTYKEAEEVINKWKRIESKKKLMMEYEKELNEKFDLSDHFIVKSNLTYNNI